MKKNNLILVALGIFTALILVSCSESTKGNWSAEDKEKFNKVVAEFDGLSSLGDKKDAFIECYFNKCQANYASFAESDADGSGVEKLALECSSEVFANGSLKGKWSDSDKEKFRNDMNRSTNLAEMGDRKDSFIECFLSKCEANYSSYYEADNDEGIDNLIMECDKETE